MTIHKDLLLIFIAAGEAHPDASRRQKLELALHRLINPFATDPDQGLTKAA